MIILRKTSDSSETFIQIKNYLDSIVFSKLWKFQVATCTEREFPNILTKKCTFMKRSILTYTRKHPF